MDGVPKFLVAFSSPKRSSPVVNVAAAHAQAIGAELILLRVLPDAEKVGVVAQLIASERPQETAQQQLDLVSAKLREKGINATGVLKVGEVGPGIVKASEELGVNLVFIGTMNLHPRPRFYMARDPIVHYLVDHLPITLCLVRPDDPRAVPAFFDPAGTPDEPAET